MRRFAWGVFLALVLAGCAAGNEQTAVQATAGYTAGYGGSQVSVSYFYESLSPYGQWLRDPSYGWCWTPYDVSVDWRPYSEGRWVYTDYGWTWVASEPWGWAPYHYGRWFFDDSYGWVWMPGTVWAPAWVAWRYSDDWVGWAPLPPAASWDASIGLRFTDAIPSYEWCFVPQRHMMDAGLHLQVTSVARNITLLDRSRDATRFEARGGRPVNLGVDVVEVQRTLGRPVPRAQIMDVDSPGHGRGQRLGSDGVAFYRPTVQPAPAEQAPPPAVVEERKVVGEEALRRRSEEQQRKLEHDLDAERARLAREQQNELRTHAPGPAADDVRRRHAAEQQAFEEHAAQQRRVMEHRMQGQMAGQGSPENAGNGNRDHSPKGKSKGKGKGKGGG